MWTPQLAGRRSTADRVAAVCLPDMRNRPYWRRSRRSGRSRREQLPRNKHDSGDRLVGGGGVDHVQQIDHTPPDIQSGP